MNEQTNFLCRSCHQVGPQHTVCGVAKCVYCNSINVELTSEPVSTRWKGGPGQRFFVRTKRARGQE